MSDLPQSGICLCPQLLPEPDVLAADAFESYSVGTETVPQISQNSVPPICLSPSLVQFLDSLLA